MLMDKQASDAMRQLASIRDAFASLATPVVSPPIHRASLAPREAVARTGLAKKPDVSFIREASQEFEDVPRG